MSSPVLPGNGGNLNATVTSAGVNVPLPSFADIVVSMLFIWGLIYTWRALRQWWAGAAAGKGLKKTAKKVKGKKEKKTTHAAEQNHDYVQNGTYEPAIEHNHLPAVEHAYDLGHEHINPYEFTHEHPHESTRPHSPPNDADYDEFVITIRGEFAASLRRETGCGGCEAKKVVKVIVVVGGSEEGN